MRFLSPHSEVQGLLGNIRGTTSSPGLYRYPPQKVKKFFLLESCALKAAASDLANTHSNIPLPADTQGFAKIFRLDNKIHGGWCGGVRSKVRLDDLGVFSNLNDSVMPLKYKMLTLNGIGNWL